MKINDKDMKNHNVELHSQFEIIRANQMGFCFGVKEAIDEVNRYVDLNKGKVYVVGMLVHNEFVISGLMKRGVIFIDEKDILVGISPLKRGDLVIIRAHGTTLDVQKKLLELEVKLIDMACVYVKSARNQLEIWENRGYRPIFIGDKNHIEVKGIASHGKNVLIYESYEELLHSSIDKNEKYVFLFQTTFNRFVFELISEYVNNSFSDFKILKTICGATHQRQQSIEELATKVDVVFIIGSELSSNTKKLYSISKNLNNNTFLLGKEDDLDEKMLLNSSKIGISAGASTPNELVLIVENKIKEIFYKKEGMDSMTEFENSFESMLDGYLPEDKKRGDIVKGIILRKETEFSYLDLNSKLEGKIFSKEILDKNIGEEVEVKIVKVDDDNIFVSKYLLDKEKEFATYEKEEIITGEVLSKGKGGYTVRIGKNEAFLPFSLSAFSRDEEVIGKKFKFIINEKQRNSIKLSRTDLVKKEEEEFLNKLNINDVVTGKIKQLLDFGLVLDLGKTTGFIHISEISWNQVDDLVKLFEIGQEITVKVIEKDLNNNKIKLSIKQMTANPWELFVLKNKVDQITNVVVKEKLDFGLVVQKDLIPGFIHISELSWTNTSETMSKINEGDNLEVKIIEIDEIKNSVKYSLKQLVEDPWNLVKSKYNVNQLLDKKIIDIFEFGLLIEVEKDIEGLIHVSELSYRRMNDLSSKYKIGDSIKSKIVGFNDDKKRISLSAKVLLDEVWNQLDEETIIETVYRGNVINKQEYGIFVELENGIEVFIHRNEFSWDRDANLDFELGQEVEFKIISIDKTNKKLAGSIKQLTVSPWKEITEMYKVGNKIRTKIIEIQENSVVVQLTERTNGIIPKKELSTEFIKNINDKFTIGQEIESIITEFNERRKVVLLSVKKIEELEESKELAELMKIYGV